MRPRSGMNGTPFSAAWNCACSAGQVASRMRIVPARIAAVKRGAGPNSPRLTAEVSSVSTQPAPISRSACKRRGRQRDEMQALDAAPDQRARRRHRHARSLARHREHTAVGDRREGFVERADDHGHVQSEIPLPAAGRVGEKVVRHCLSSRGHRDHTILPTRSRIGLLRSALRLPLPARGER